MTAIILNTRMEEQIYELAEASLNRIGYEIVRIMFMEGTKRQTLQIMIDCVDGRQIKVEDCEKASRHLSALLDVEDPISDRYNLEVSSAGIDRPLTRLKDFERYKNTEIKLETKLPFNGQKRFRGVLLGVKGESDIQLQLNLVDLGKTGQEEILTVPFSSVLKAKIILTDELLKQHS